MDALEAHAEAWSGAYERACHGYAEAVPHARDDAPLRAGSGRLACLADLSGPEIAEVLGISPTTVRTRLLRARAALREVLAVLDPRRNPSDEELEASVTALRNEA